jgi:hypothetical protein
VKHISNAGGRHIAEERGVRPEKPRREQHEPPYRVRHFRRRRFGLITIPVFPMYEISHDKPEQV